jgi:hypothetical protein
LQTLLLLIILSAFLSKMLGILQQAKIDEFVKSRISPPLVGGNKGAGEITT